MVVWMDIVPLRSNVARAVLPPPVARAQASSVPAMLPILALRKHRKCIFLSELDALIPASMALIRLISALQTN